MRSSPYIALIITVALLGATRPTSAQTCAFDAQGRLTMVKYSSTQTVAYAYDDAGNITNQVVSGILGEPDTDSDSLPDAWEWVWLNSLTNTAAGDFNQDTISNLKHYQDGTDPADPDTDHDGMLNVDEIVAGTSPTNASSRFMVSGYTLTQASNRQVVTWSTVTGRFYDVDSTTNLLLGNAWTSLIANLPGIAGTLSITNPPIPAQQLYRIRVRQP
jgi:YD repeat-containing protein